MREEEEKGEKERDTVTGIGRWGESERGVRMEGIGIRSEIGERVKESGIVSSE